MQTRQPKIQSQLIIQLQHRHEGLLRHIHLAHGLHALLAFGLFLEQFLLAGDITAIALSQHILTNRTDAGGRNDSTSN